MISQRYDIIRLSLIPKRNKTTYLTFKRELQDCEKAVAIRLKTILPPIVNNAQTGYLEERFIGENIRVISDLITHRIISADSHWIKLIT